MILALTSDTMPLAADVRRRPTPSSQQKLSQIEGVGQVIVGGGALPAVRVRGQSRRCSTATASASRTCARRSASANANRPKGELADGDQHLARSAPTTSCSTADEYQPLIVAYRNGAAGAPARRRRRRSTRSRTSAPAAWPTASRAVLLIIFRQPGANIIDTVDRVTRAAAAAAGVDPAGDRRSTSCSTARTTIRASVHDVELTLLISIVLVILVVFVFLRNVRATLIPSVAVPVSLIGTFGVMYLLGYSLDNLSLMALTIATGFVVDDAIVVIENITRYLEAGHDAARGGAAGARRRSASPSSRSASRWSRCSSRSC